MTFIDMLASKDVVYIITFIIMIVLLIIFTVKQYRYIKDVDSSTGKTYYDESFKELFIASSLVILAVGLFLIASSVQWVKSNNCPVLSTNGFDDGETTYEEAN